jgi:sulfate/thiosulfate transport system ATP-binding protein
MSISVSVETLEKQFGTFPALRGVSLDVQPGELVALLGPSGSGKTTMLRLMAGLEQADQGRVLFDGIDTRTLTLRERRIGFVFQHYALFKHMTVADNIAFGLKALPRRQRPSTADIRARVSTLLDLVQLSGLETRFPAQLSGGQRQRVALARALAIEPRVLLLDEPFGALDAKVRKDLRRWLRELHDKTGHTTLFVTHDQDEALELADRVAILNEGRIEQVGTPDDVYDHPASAFVCEFLGETNKIPVVINNKQAFWKDQHIALDEGLLNGFEGAALLYVRPQYVRLTPPDPASLQGILTRVRRHGAFRRAEIEVMGLPHKMEVELAAQAIPAIGARVGLHFQRAHLYPL